jgi:hypothetical protein
MTLVNIQYTNVSTSSLSVGSEFTRDDLLFYTDGTSSLNFPFGKLDRDFVRFSVFNLDNTPVTSSLVYSTGTYKEHTQSYYDVNNRHSTYSYKTFTTDWPLLGSPTKSLFFDVTKELNQLSVGDGNYILMMELVRNMVGSESSSTDRIIIDTISTNRDEIALIPKSLVGTNSTIATDYSIFASGQLKVKEVAQDLLDAIGTPQFYTTYYSAAALHPTGSNSLKHNYGFNSRTVQTPTGSQAYGQGQNSRGIGYNSDIDVIAFLTDMFYGVRKGGLKASGQYASNDILGIYDQFKNWLFSNYESGVTFQDIQNYYYSLFRYVADVELSHLSNKKPTDYDSIIGFLQEIYYNSIFYPPASKIADSYITNVTGYFKNHVNFNDGTAYSILNQKLVPSADPRFNSKMVLKLDQPLPLRVSVGGEVWITNTFGFQPIVQNLYYFTSPDYQTIRLRGPNFLIRAESEGNSTEAMSMEQLIEETGSLYNELLSKIGARDSASVDSTDYRYFANFVNFSSATLRMSAFDMKKENIAQLRLEIEDLNSKLSGNPSDTFYQTELETANNQLDQVEASMDGYENFLYNNSHWYPTHAESASLYDRDNGGSLINNLPQFIVEDYSNNSDYITFVGMIGHFFDNMSVSVKQLTEKNNYSSSPSYGISLDVVHDMLRSLGWETEISKDNLPLLLSSFSKSDFDVGTEFYNTARSFSEEERNQVIWKRILNTLPYLYKTKGTEAGLNALITCFGIPKNIVKIREYGGIHKTHNLQDSTLCIVDEVKYEPYFSGSGEYFQINWTGSAQTVEFNFAFDTTKTSTEGKVFRLANCSGSWVIGAYRERGLDWGRLFFSIDGGAAGVQTIMTDKAPIFDGNTYHAMLRRNNPAAVLGLSGATPQQVDAYPIKYDLLVQKSTDARITYAASASYYFSGSFNGNFRSGSYLYVGNYQQATASLNMDPEAFFGNVDEIKIWEGVVDDTRFTNHTLHQNAYDMDTPQQMVSENVFRISFERPVDLYDTSSVSLNNLSFRGDFPTFHAVNFPAFFGGIPKYTECGPESASIFPYQFTRKDVRQTMKLPDYGASKFRSNKINYVEQELVSHLSSTARASMQSSELVSVDANRLGIFFSPTETQNSEIIKFFGDYPLMDLIGDPSSIYDSSYKKFEKFKQIFYSQGFGVVDYQFFMNIVRFYFDKAMLKYIRSMVPARAKLVDGILVEPSILERPKIALKPMSQETIPQKVGTVNATSSLHVTRFPKMTASLEAHHSGVSILRDVNQTMFPTVEDKYGFGSYADRFGLTYYNGQYYRIDVVDVVKSHQVYNKYNLPSSSLTDYEKNTNLHGTVQTISTDYYKTNLVGLPLVSEYPMTMSFVSPSGSFHFSGSVGFGPVDIQGNFTYTASMTHTISGVVYGDIKARDPRTNVSFDDATILSPGMIVRGVGATTSGSFMYIGNFSLSGSVQMFDGNVRYYNPTFSAPPAHTSYIGYNVTFFADSSADSIFDKFITGTSAGNKVFPRDGGLTYRLDVSKAYYPANATPLVGYFPTHYKYGKEQFSHKMVNSYDQNNTPVKWKKGSQNKKTTIDPSSGLLDNTDPVQTKSS